MHPKVSSVVARTWIAALVLIGLGLALRLPALHAGLGMDDFAQRAMLDGTYPVPRRAWDLFAFSHGDRAEVVALQNAGSLPWWSDPTLAIAPFRPLSSVLVWLDVRWFGTGAVGPHVHSLAWFVAMVLAAWWMLRPVLPRLVMLAALGLFALDDSHAYPVAWLANRSAIVAATFVFVAVGSHLRHREHGWRIGSVLAPIATVAALAAGEYGLAAIAYLAAYELLGRGDPLRVRVRALVPAIAIAIAWVGVYRLVDAGAYGSSIYVDPLREPAAAMHMTAERLPILLSNLMLALPTGELSITGEGLRAQTWIGGALLVLLAAWSRRPVALVARTAGHPRWWLAAAVLATLPQIAAFPSARLVLVPALAADVVLARLLVTAIERARHGDRVHARAGWGVIAALIITMHGGLAPLWGQREMAAIRTVHAASIAASDTLPATIDADTPVVVLSASDPMTLLYPPLIARARGRPAPARWSVLSLVPGPHALTRRSVDAIDLVPRSRPMLHSQVEQLFRRPPPDFAVGDRVVLDALTVEILAVADGHPTAIGVTFDRPLEAIAFLIATPRGYVRYPMPAIGTTVTLPPAAFPLL